MSLGCAVCIHDMESPAFGFRSLELLVVGQPKFMGSQLGSFWLSAVDGGLIAPFNSNSY